MDRAEIGTAYAAVCTVDWLSRFIANPLIVAPIQSHHPSTEHPPTIPELVIAAQPVVARRTRT